MIFVCLLADCVLGSIGKFSQRSESYRKSVSSNIMQLC